MFDMALVQQCAPHVSPQTMAAIIRTESGFNPLAIHVNGDFRLPAAPRSAPEAIGWAEYLIHAGYSVDLGLMQINSRNLGALSMTVTDAFDPCTNLRGGARILTANYRKAAQAAGPGSTALLAAISAYNTGNFRGGFANGYVAKVVSNSSHFSATHATPAQGMQACWLGSCMTVSGPQVARWLTIPGSTVVAVWAGYFFRTHPWAWNALSDWVRALRDALAGVLRGIGRA